MIPVPTKIYITLIDLGIPKTVSKGAKDLNPIAIPARRRTLSHVREGEDVMVIQVEGGRGVHRRLRELGIGTGSRVKVIQNTGGPVIVMVGDSRMGLGRGVAEKIVVE